MNYVELYYNDQPDPDVVNGKSTDLHTIAFKHVLQNLNTSAVIYIQGDKWCTYTSNEDTIFCSSGDKTWDLLDDEEENNDWID